MQRLEITDGQVIKAIELLTQNVGRRLEEKGRGAYASTHEAYGIIAEEFNKELLDALHSNNPYAFAQECMDVAVGCIFAVASMVAGGEAVLAENCTCDPNQRDACNTCPSNSCSCKEREGTSYTTCACGVGVSWDGSSLTTNSEDDATGSKIVSSDEC